MAHYILMSVTKIYQLLAIIVTILVFSSCQKEVVVDPTLGNTTAASDETAHASSYGDAAPEK